MELNRIELVSKDVKAKDLKDLYEMNQVVKKVYDSYYVLNDSKIIGSLVNESKFSLYDICHYEKISFLFDLLDIRKGSALQLESNTIYVTFRDNRKHISSIYIMDGDIYIGLEPEDIPDVIIGHIITETKYVFEGRQAADRIMSMELDIISPKDVGILVESEVLNVSKGNLRVRLVKKVIPHLGKGAELAVGFFDEDKDTFKIVVRMTKADVGIHHVFKCIKY